MKTRLIIASVLIIVSVLTGFLSLFAITKSCDELEKALKPLLPSEVSDNSHEVNLYAGRVSAVWENKKTLFHILTNHTELSEFETDIENMVYYAESGNTDKAAALARECYEAVNHIKRSAEPSLSNIF